MKRWTNPRPRPIVPVQPRGRTTGTNQTYIVYDPDGNKHKINCFRLDALVSTVRLYAEEFIMLLELVAEQPERWASNSQFAREAIREKLAREGKEVPPEEYWIEKDKIINKPGRPPGS